MHATSARPVTSMFYWTESLRNSALSSSAKVVALILATHVNKAGNCYVSQETLLAETSIRSKNTLKTALAELVAAHFVLLEVSTGRGNATTYQAALPSWMPLDRPKGDGRKVFGELRARTGKGSESAPLKGSKSTERGQSLTPNSPSTNSHRNTTTPPTPQTQESDLEAQETERVERVVMNRGEAAGTAGPGLRPSGVSAGVWQVASDLLGELEGRMDPLDWAHLVATWDEFDGFKAWTWMAAGCVEAGRRSALLDSLLHRESVTASSYSGARDPHAVLIHRTRTLWKAIGSPRPATKAVAQGRRYDTASIVSGVVAALGGGIPAQPQPRHDATEAALQEALGWSF